MGCVPQSVREDRDKLLRVILETQERVAREILLRKEETVRAAAQQSALEGQCKQREGLIDSLMKQRQELQMRLGRMGELERELESTRAKVEAAADEKQMLSKRCVSTAVGRAIWARRLWTPLRSVFTALLCASVP